MKRLGLFCPNIVIKRVRLAAEPASKTRVERVVQRSMGAAAFNLHIDLGGTSYRVLTELFLVVTLAIDADRLSGNRAPSGAGPELVCAAPGAGGAPWTFAGRVWDFEKPVEAFNRGWARKAVQ